MAGTFPETERTPEDDILCGASCPTLQSLPEVEALIVMDPPLQTSKTPELEVSSGLPFTVIFSVASTSHPLASVPTTVISVVSVSW